MPSVLICQAMLRQRPGRFRDVLVDAGFECIDPAPGLALAHEQLRELMPEADALLLGLERLTSDLFAIAPRLRVVARTGVGYDGVDLDAARKHGVVVTTTPGANHDSVAEHVFALLLAMTREVIPNDAAIHAGGWARRPGVPIRGKTLGLYGLGRIARAVAVRAKAFDMRILAHDLRPPSLDDDILEIERVLPDDLLAASDVISLHVPLNESTQNLVDSRFFARMKPGTYLINTARGGIVVDADLRAALESGRLAGAGIDVFHQEPPPLDCPLRGAPNLILSPHVGGTDSGAVQDMAEAAARCIVDLYRGRWPSPCVVDESLREGWVW